jgi:hypothetical protein
VSLRRANHQTATTPRKESFSPNWEPDTRSNPREATIAVTVPGHRLNGTPIKRLVVHRASEIAPVPVEWLWPERIAIGKTTLIGGDPGLGKSQLSMSIAATITRGGEWPCREGRAPTRSVVILCAEDGISDTIVPRLMAAEANREKVRIITSVTEENGSGRRIFNLSKDLDILEDLIKEIGGVGLIVIAVDAYIGAGVDSHKNAAVRAVLEPISELADRLKTAVIAVTHFSKHAAGKAMYRFIGSIAHVGQLGSLSRSSLTWKMMVGSFFFTQRTIWPRPRRDSHLNLSNAQSVTGFSRPLYVSRMSMYPPQLTKR